MIHHQDRPAIKIAIQPATATKDAVPKSGCIKIKTVGIPTITKAIMVFKIFGGRLPLDKKVATISGITTLKISDG